MLNTLVFFKGIRPAGKSIRPDSFRWRAFGTAPCTYGKKTALYFGTIWPDPNASAAGVRTESLLSQVTKMGFKVHYCSPARSRLIPSELFERLGVEAHRLSSVNSDETDVVLKTLCPKLVILDRFLTEEMVGWRVRSNCPDCAIVLDSQDLHCLRLARQHVIEEIEAARGYAPSRGTEYYLNAIQKEGRYQAERQSGTFEPSRLVEKSKHADIIQVGARYALVREHFLREVASFHRSDLVLVSSNFEKEYLIKKFQISADKLFCAPFYVEVPSGETKSFQHRRGLCFLGNFRHPPNRDAISWLKRDIWPRLRQSLPKDAFIDVFGANPQREDILLSDPENGFRVSGPVKPSALFQRLQLYRALLAPLRFGAGVKGKIVDAWKSGTPVITTSIGAEGMYLRDGERVEFGGAVADDPESIALQTSRIYCNQSDWHQARLSGGYVLRSKFSEEGNGPALRARLQHVIRNLESVRKRNVVGQILEFSTNKYNEMLAKYIQLKDNNQASADQRPVHPRSSPDHDSPIDHQKTREKIEKILAWSEQLSPTKPAPNKPWGPLALDPSIDRTLSTLKRSMIGAHIKRDD
ncbi:uncharacterized protein LOC126317451 [Schistocerca gregaria]|uniref:uncharacterized protein LOC126317451 n=1 Tax=Schistocerca gregaria TaxID=7010 RepID=UPI00211DC133|nr:uncharacterized protein LOC126317451 [Schistocerca gregaria]